MSRYGVEADQSPQCAPPARGRPDRPREYWAEARAMVDVHALKAVLPRRHSALALVAGNLDRRRYEVNSALRDMVLLANVLHGHPSQPLAGHAREAVRRVRLWGKLPIHSLAPDDERVCFTP